PKFIPSKMSSLRSYQRLIVGLIAAPTLAWISSAQAASVIGPTSSNSFPSPISNEFSSLLRFRGIAHIASGGNPAQQNEIYLGHTDLGVGQNRAQGDLVWKDASLHNWEIKYDGATTISVTVANATGSTSLTYDYTPLWAGIDPSATSFSLENIKIYSKDSDRNDANSNIDVHQAVGNIQITSGATLTQNYPAAAFNTALNADQTLRFTAIEITNIVGFESGPWRLSGTWIPTSISNSTNGTYETSTLEFAFGGSLAKIPEPSTAYLVLAAGLAAAFGRRRSPSR
ncbi:MAG: PEP-CTERM sorting domain-containing protein, partial [Verrucomicrobiota bacterium]